jgi:hypothetical protein
VLVLNACLLALAGCNAVDSQPGEEDPVKIVRPNGGESFKVGDTLVIEWTIDRDKVQNTLLLDISTNWGKSFATIWVGEEGAIGPDSPLYDGNRGTYRWEIPAKINNIEGFEVSLVSDSCVIRLEEEYSVTEDQDPNRDVSDAPFSIGAGP